ncbi:SMP-30/gluconolactonase/LRE family protein [Chryseobacterium sp.]|jgi:gluconolactonase|uniref:SMP-30/gluconolactonase/LRE family protein n=1 Tax=Chryseobacterium sp. TaxID=1871047 RepID=UPI002625B93B|nr:SMP-30/gluconolactonase/LRE family protein [Chryseobacterium sp.]
MKRILNLGLIGLVLAFLSCKSQNYNAMFDNTEPKLVSDQFTFTEGPAADKAGNVYFTDQPNDKIYVWDWKTNKITEFLDKSGRANGTYFDENDHLITCSDKEGEIWKISKDKSVEVLSKGFEGKRLNGPNDLWLDGNGGIYFTDPLYKRDYWENFKVEIPEKNLYYRNKDGKISKLETFTQPNGIIGSIKSKKLYVSDIDAGKTYVYDILGEGKLSEKKLFCEMGSDGMTLDKEGNLYLTGDGVTIFNNKGEKIHHIKIPEDWTGNVTFGGENNNVLFITASKSVYTLPTKTKGLR